MAFPRPSRGPEIGNLARIGRKPNAPVLKLPKSTIEHRDRSISTLKNNNSIQLSPLNAGNSSMITSSIFEDDSTNNLLNGGGSTLSNYQILQQQQYLQSQSSASLRQLSKQRDIALKEQQKLSKSISTMSRINSSSKKTIKALRLSNEEL